MPGNITQDLSYTLTGETTGLSYFTTDADGETVPLMGWSQATDLFGRVVAEVTPGDAHDPSATGEYTRTYAYDRAGRLVTVEDRTAEIGVGLVTEQGEDPITPCVTRSYDFDVRGNRLSRTTAVSDADGTCTSNGGAVESWVYDSADRIQTGANGTGSYVYDEVGRQTVVPALDTPSGMDAGNLSIGYYDNDLVASLSQDGATTTFGLDALQRRTTATTVSEAGTSTLTRHYTDATDNPAWATSTDTDGVTSTTWYGSSIGGDLGVTVTDDVVTVQFADIHGDSSISMALDEFGAVNEISGYSDYDEYGRPVAGTATPDTGAVTYGWLGANERATDDVTGLLLMGVRLYNPVTGQFTSVDPVPGGNSTAYAYPQDPINQFDLDGRAWGWLKKVANVARVVAKVAAVASFIPGPIGMIAAGVEVAAHLASGNYKAAAAASLGLVPGGKLLGTAVKIASKVGKSGKLAKVVAKVTGRCNSFEPDTLVTMADGTQKPIEDVVVGDKVLSSDGTTVVAEPVVDLIRHLDAHLWVDLTIVTDGGSETIATTDEHPFWVLAEAGDAVVGAEAQPAGSWVDAIDLKVGDAVTTADGTIARVVATTTREAVDWAYNLTIATTHTYYVGDDPVLVHNATCSIAAHNVPKRSGIYTLHYADGTKYVGMSKNMHARVHAHQRGPRSGFTAVTTRAIKPSWLRRAEQATIDRYGGIRGGTLRNSINSIRRR